MSKDADWLAREVIKARKRSSKVPAHARPVIAQRLIGSFHTRPVTDPQPEK